MQGVWSSGEDIVIDTKDKCYRKPVSEIQIMIYEELYGKDWHMRVANELKHGLEELKVGSDVSEENKSESKVSRQVKLPIVSCAEDSLQKKQKGCRVSYHERIYLFEQMVKGESSFAWIAYKYNLSLGTLYNIRREFEAPIPGLPLGKPITDRNLVESSVIQNLVRNFLCTFKTPWTSKDIWDYILRTTGTVIHERTIRKILKEVLGMRYKKGLARLINFNEEYQIRIKQWFSIKLWKVIGRFELLINIDESSFSRLTKKSLSWIPKGKEQIIKSIWFRNSWSLVTAITTSGSVIAAKRNKTITSDHFVEFLWKLVKFISKEEKVEPQRCLFILDNASIHRSDKIKEYMKSKNLSIAYIPQYSPELAPIEHYFSKLKHEVTKQTKGKSVDWRSKESNQFLRKWMLLISSRIVKRIWTSFTKQIYGYLDSY